MASVPCCSLSLLTKHTQSSRRGQSKVLPKMINAEGRMLKHGVVKVNHILRPCL
jgi:hypothetical protein